MTDYRVPPGRAIESSTSPGYGLLLGVDLQTRDRGRTTLGVALVMVGIGIDWIPYVEDVGGVLLLTGVVLVFLGRRAYGPAHRRMVNVAAGLLIAAEVGALVIGFALAAVLAGAPNPGFTAAQSVASLHRELEALNVASQIVWGLVALSECLLIYRLAEPTIRSLLWVALVLTVICNAIVGAETLPTVQATIVQASSGSGASLGPLLVSSLTWGVLLAGPSLLLAYGYYRTRGRLVRADRNGGTPA